MKDGVKAGEQAEVSRQEVYEDYVNCFRELCTEAQPCRDARLLKKAAEYLLREPEPRAFPFYQAVREGSEAPSTDYRKRLSALVKAAELLETLCVNLFLQPWKKEIKTLKTFTGPFVYCLLPVLSTSTIQSVLASIGYLPHTDTPQSEYRLSEDADPEGAMQVGFELLLARVECYRLLELLEKDQLGPQEWLEVLQRRVGPSRPEEPTEQKTTTGEKEGEEKKQKKKEKEEEVDRKEAPLYLDTRLAVNPQPKPRHCPPTGLDQSIMEMQMTYPDLAFRGRPLLQDKPHRATSSRNCIKAVRTASARNHSDDSRAADLPRRGCIKGTKAAAATVRGSKADEVFSNGGRGGAPGDAISSSFGNGDRSRADDELSGPQAISLPFPLKAGSPAEQSLKLGESQPTAEPPSWRQQQTAADLQNKRRPDPEPPSLSSIVDEQQNLRELEERMGQLHVHETQEEVKRNEANKRGEETDGNKEGKARTGGEEEEPGPASSRAAGRCTAPSQPDPAGTTEQKQPTGCQCTADGKGWKEGGGTGRQEGGDTERVGEEEQLAQGFVIIDHLKK